MKFALAIDWQRTSPDQDIRKIADETLELVSMAEAGGFAQVYAAEHHSNELTNGPNPFVMLAHWANHTKHIRLGTAVAVAPYWHPLRLAAEAAVVDIISGGRLEFGIGRGAFQYEFDRMAGGIPQNVGSEHLREALPAILKLWQGDYTHNGKHWQWPSATSVPKPVQKPHPPLWIAARDPDTFDFAIKMGAGIMSNPLSKPFAEMEVLADKFKKACADNPGKPRPEWMILRRTCVFDSLDDWDVPYQASLDYSRAFQNLFRNTGGVKNGFAERLAIDSLDNKDDLSREAILDNLMFGTPDMVVKKLRQYEAVGTDIFLYGMSFGLPHKHAKRSLELFIKNVMPHFTKGKGARVAAAQ